MAHPNSTSRPKHYKIIAISIYTKDLVRLDKMVAEQKARGNRQATRSALIRHALDGVDPDKLLADR